MENKIIIGNMKMYMNIQDIDKYLKEMENKITNNVILCPTNIYIPYFLNKGYNIGIQNVHYQESGSYTGEVSPKQAYDIGIRYSIVGHSERRLYFNETDIDINKKVKSCLSNNLSVILCIGETEEEKNMLKTDIVLKHQLKIALNDIDKKYQDKIIIAYEPRWAIGTNKIPSNKEIKDSINYIKLILKQCKLDLKVVYGGSINDKNIEVLKNIDNIDGFMVGTSSVDTKKFGKIIEIINS